jgi:hypothetical protein
MLIRSVPYGRVGFRNAAMASDQRFRLAPRIARVPGLAMSLAITDPAGRGRDTRAIAEVTLEAVERVAVAMRPSAMLTVSRDTDTLCPVGARNFAHCR